MWTAFFAILCIVLVMMKFVNWLAGLVSVHSSPSDHYVLITGCDSGFGRCLARRLDNVGYRVFGACLTPRAVEELKLTSRHLLPFVMDVTKDDDIEKAFALITSALPENRGLWAVVNNAGIMGPTGAAEWLSRADFLGPLQVNVLGMTQVIRRFLPLIRRERGRVVNTTSVLGRVAIGPAPYIVSKYAAVGFTEILRRELSPQGVTVHSIEPGAYATNITNSDLMRQSLQQTLAAAPPDVRRYYGNRYADKLIETVELMNRFLTGTNLEEVVDAYLHALTSRRPLSRYVVGWNGNIVFRTLWMMPSWLTDLLTRAVFPVPDGQ